MAENKTAPRRDKRYKNNDSAPTIVSEQRLTFFLPDSAMRELRRQAGMVAAANASAEATAEIDAETPSAIVRMACMYWLDQFRAAADRTATEKEWQEKISAVRAATKR